MDWNEVITSVVLVAIPALIGIAMKWFAAQKWAKDAEDQLFFAIEGAAQRAKDKYLEEIVLAQRPESDGGVVVTAAEKSIARDRALRYVYDNLKGPVLDYAKDKGENLLKGWIGKALDKILPKTETAPAPAAELAVAQ